MSGNKCYDCIHRREVAGSAHSSCAHPATKDVQDNSLAQLIGMFGKRGGMPVIPCRALETLNIRANHHGIRNGWFIWPLNFDPAWLENCDGFEAKKAEGRQ